MGRLVVVSNRVPGNGGAGGLAVGLRAALREAGGLWFGWSGRTSESSEPTISDQDAFQLGTIDLPAGELDAYYNGCANRGLWPLLHSRLDLAAFDPDSYRAYQRVNALFAERLLPLLAADDTLWVHDYHLIPLGCELRRRGVRNPIGFFLHIPFPPPEVVLALPWCKDFARYLCAYDLVGFQTERDLRNFHDFVEREAGGSVADDGSVTLLGHRFEAGSFPIGIDAEAFAAMAASPQVERLCRRVTACLNGRAGLIGVDRLDYSKGLPERLRAFEALLESSPQYRGRSTLVQVAAPSRETVPEYSSIRGEIEGIVGRINGRFGRMGWQPIHYVNRSFSQPRLAALFRLYRVGLVTPLHDGMNLVAKEFIAAQDPRDPGVLVLSRFAGAAETLTAALIVNPYDAHGTAATLRSALEMPIGERRARWQAMMTEISRYDISYWRRSFLRSLASSRRATAFYRWAAA